MMRRGCRVLFVHFHSYPILSRASQEKARELARLLTRFQFHSRLFLVPFGEIQQRVVLAVAPPLRVVIYRRLMMRIAEADRARAPGAGARHRRSRRPGRVADAREHDADRRRRDACRCCGRWSAWTRTRSPRRRSGSARIRSRSSPTRTAARCSRRATRRRKARRDDVERAEAACRFDEIVVRPRSPRPPWSASISRIKMKGFVPVLCRRSAVKITPGKLAGMKAVSDDRGVIAAAAMDQRGSLKKALAKEKGGDVGDGTWRSSRSSSPKC